MFGDVDEFEADLFSESYIAQYVLGRAEGVILLYCCLGETHKTDIFTRTTV
jgi:hypothetical protein